VTGYDGEQPIYNTRFLAFATHYGFRPWACRPRRPQTKGYASYCTSCAICG
jgi:transposase